MKTEIKKEDMVDEWVSIPGFERYEVNPARAVLRSKRTQRILEKGRTCTVSSGGEQYSATVDRYIFCALNGIDPRNLPANVFRDDAGSLTIRDTFGWRTKLSRRTYPREVVRRRYDKIRRELPLIEAAADGDSRPLGELIFKEYTDSLCKYLRARWQIPRRVTLDDFLSDIVIEILGRIQRGVVVSDIEVELRRVANSMVNANLRRRRSIKYIGDMPEYKAKIYN